MEKQSNPLANLRKFILQHEDHNVQKVALSTLRAAFTIIIALWDEEELFELLKTEQGLIAQLCDDLKPVDVKPN